MDGGRKWALARLVFGASTTMAVVGIALAFLGKVSFMDVLQWWSLTQGGVMALYNGSNVIQKGVVKGDPNSVPS